MWLLISTLPCPYVIINHYYSLLWIGNALGLVHGRKWEWLLKGWTNRLGKSWETSEEGEMWRFLILYMVVTIDSLLLSSLSEVWGHALPFLVCPSSYFVFILFCFSTGRRGFCAAFLQLFLIHPQLCVCMALPQHLFVQRTLQRTWKRFTEAFQLPSPLLSTCGASFL